MISQCDRNTRFSSSAGAARSNVSTNLSQKAYARVEFLAQDNVLN